jgi:hypothetical protein
VVRRGGYRTRRHVVPGEVPVWCLGGRWGPRRVRVEQCLFLRAEDVYHRLILQRMWLRPGRRGTAHLVAPNSPSGGWPAAFEVRRHPIWRQGRVFFRCAACGRLATRVYLPPGASELRCRRCWGLNYESQKWSYRGDRWARLPYYSPTERRREERRAEAKLRYARRRRYPARGACAR